MPLRFQSQLQLDLLPDEAVDNKFEVIMPSIRLINSRRTTGGLVGAAINAISGASLSGLGASGNVGNKVSDSKAAGIMPYIPIVEEITFGPQNLQTDFTRINSYYYGYPLDKTPIKNVNITMFLDSGLLAWYYIQSWKDLIFNEEGEYYYSSINYKKDIIVVFYGLGSALPVAKFTLKGCFPIETSQFQLGYQKEPKRLRLTQTFSVDRIEPDYSKAANAIVSTLTGGNPLGIAQDQLLAQASLSMSEAGNAGWSD